MNIKKNYGHYYRRFQAFSKEPLAKISGLASLTIFAIAFFLIFAILPTFKTIASLNREIKDTELINSQLQKKIVSLNKAEEVYAEAGASLSKIDNVLPETESFERLAWQIYWLANKNNLEVNSGNFGEFGLIGFSQDKNKAQELVLEMTVGGEYRQIKQWLTDLEKFDRLIEIKELTINKKRLRSEGGVINATITVSAYYLPNGNNDNNEENL